MQPHPSSPSPPAHQSVQISIQVPEQSGEQVLWDSPLLPPASINSLLIEIRAAAASSNASLTELVEAHKGKAVAQGKTDAPLPPTPPQQKKRSRKAK